MTTIRNEPDRVTEKNKMRSYGVVEVEARDGSVYTSVNLEPDQMEGDEIEVVTDFGRKCGMIVGVFLTQQEADAWTQKMNCE